MHQGGLQRVVMPLAAQLAELTGVDPTKVAGEWARRSDDQAEDIDVALANAPWHETKKRPVPPLKAKPLKQEALMKPQPPSCPPPSSLCAHPMPSIQERYQATKKRGSMAIIPDDDAADAAERDDSEETSELKEKRRKAKLKKKLKELGDDGIY